jgi:hypothetical protein
MGAIVNLAAFSVRPPSWSNPLQIFVAHIWLSITGCAIAHQSPIRIKAGRSELAARYTCPWPGTPAPENSQFLAVSISIERITRSHNIVASLRAIQPLVAWPPNNSADYIGDDSYMPTERTLLNVQAVHPHHVLVYRWIDVNVYRNRPAERQRRRNRRSFLCFPASAPTITSSIWQRILVATARTIPAAFLMLPQGVRVTPKSSVAVFMQKYASFSELKVYRFSTEDLVLGKYPGKQSPFVADLWRRIAKLRLRMHPDCIRHTFLRA